MKRTTIMMASFYEEAIHRPRRVRGVRIEQKVVKILDMLMIKL